MASMWAELKRRNVVRVAIAYAVAAWLVLQVADTVTQILELPNWIIQSVLLLLSIGFVIAVIVAWAFELTPDGVVREKDVDHSKPITPATRRKLDAVIIGLMAVAILYLVFDNYVLDGAPPDRVEAATSSSVAVLPFVALSSGQDDGYFADGLTEEILNALTQLSDLQVTARTSSFFFKGQNIPIPEIAARLGVAHIVEGSVRRDGNRLRITAQLIRASDGFRLWSDSYDETLDDVFAVQEDISEQIASAMGVVLDDDALEIMRSSGIRDVNAFIAYQRGLKAFADAHSPIERQRTGLTLLELLEDANVLFDQALEVAPGFTAARLMRADRRGHLVSGISYGERQEQFDGEAQQHLTAFLEELATAIRLSAPGNQRDVLELERTLWTDDWNGLPRLIPKALQPAGCVQIVASAEVLVPFGWAALLAEKLRDMLACDPFDVETNQQLPSALLWAAEPQAALSAIAALRDRGLDGGFTIEEVEIISLLALGRTDEAKSLTTSSKAFEVIREAAAGDPTLAQEMAEEYWAAPFFDWGKLRVAAAVGDHEQANRLAARIDSLTGSFIVLIRAIRGCYCGAPFDLDQTPNFKSRIEEAELPWPPPNIIDFPLKTW